MRSGSRRSWIGAVIVLLALPATMLWTYTVGPVPLETAPLLLLVVAWGAIWWERDVMIERLQALRAWLGWVRELFCPDRTDPQCDAQTAGRVWVVESEAGIPGEESWRTIAICSTRERAEAIRSDTRADEITEWVLDREDGEVS